MLHSEIKSIEEYFSSGKINPGSVQRDFEWGQAFHLKKQPKQAAKSRNECEELFNDLERACSDLDLDLENTVTDPASLTGSLYETDDDEENESGLDGLDFSQNEPPQTAPEHYFLGSIILMPVGNGVQDVYDGLQRTTALTILFCVLRDLMQEDTETWTRLNNLVMDGDDFRLTLPGKDQTLINEAQTPGSALKKNSRSVSDRGYRIRLTVRMYRNIINKWTVERQKRFIDYLLVNTKISVIETSDEALARQIFVCNNLRGKPLNRIDLFKGQLADIMDTDEGAEKVVQWWAELQGSLGKDLEEFILCCDIIERKKTQGPECLTDLTNHLQKKYGSEKLFDWIEKTNLYAKAWKEFHAKMRSPEDNKIDRNIFILRFFKWREWKPLAIFWYADYISKRHNKAGGSATTATKNLKKRFNRLHRACMAMTLKGYSATARVTIFINAMKQSNPFSGKPNQNKKYGALTFDLPSRARINETLKLPLEDDAIRLTLVRWLEASQCPNFDIPDDLAKATVEHVLPRHPHFQSDWVTKYFPDEDRRFLLCHSIGNLAPMDYEPNIAIENFDFKLGWNKKDKIKTIKQQAKKYKLLVDISQAKEWTEDHIQERANKLVNMVWEKLDIGQPPAPAA